MCLRFHRTGRSGAKTTDRVVITTDHFGNLISNIERADVEAFSLPVIQAGGHDIPFLRTYGDATPGSLLALINSFGVLEIACAEQNAAEALGIGRGAPIRRRSGGDAAPSLLSANPCGSDFSLICSMHRACPGGVHETSD